MNKMPVKQKKMGHGFDSYFLLVLLYMYLYIYEKFEYRPFAIKLSPIKCH